MTTILRRAARRDLNEPGIVNVFRDAGCVVIPLSMRDVPDLLVGFLSHWHLVEVKRDMEPLTPGQAVWHDAASTAGERPLVIRTEAHARKAVKMWTIARARELGAFAQSDSDLDPIPETCGKLTSEPA